LLRAAHPEVFNLLRVVVISGECYLCKPHVPMYEYALEKLRQFDNTLQPNEIVFLDDEQENVNGAGLAGFQAHRYDNLKM
jgi:HAD superfamily hydrolase (TIGR01509 family)